MKTPNNQLKHRVVFRKEVWTGDEIWESIRKTVERGCSGGFRDGTLGCFFLSRGSKGEEGPRGDLERAVLTGGAKPREATATTAGRHVTEMEVPCQRGQKAEH